MKAIVNILPPQQARLWPELAAVPGYFVLYGGTAVALRLGGRQSVDFDFFTEQPLSADELLREIPFLRGSHLIQAEPNTATFSVEREGEVNVSFFGGLSFGRVGIPEQCDDNGVWIASSLDLAAQKLKVILVRAEAKDYFDIYTLLKSGVPLARALGATMTLYPELNPLLPLKALSYYGEPSLATVPWNIREYLTAQSERFRGVEPVEKLSSNLSV